MSWMKLGVIAYWFEGCDVAFTAGDIVHYETAGSLASVLVVEKIAGLCQSNSSWEAHAYFQERTGLVFVAPVYRFRS